MENPNQHTIKINLPGGIVSPGDLLGILKVASACGVKNIRFGNRQQLYFLIEENQLGDLEESLLLEDVIYEVNTDIYPNILSSYVTEEILSPVNWLREGVYKDILNGFTYQPQLKINIVDANQNLIPFFTGHLNFISAEVSNFWYLHIRFPKSNQMFRWPVLIYSGNIPDLSEALEHLMNASIKEALNGDLLFQQINQTHKFVYQDYQKPLIHTDFYLPYYEGLNKYGDQKQWLGVYRRREEFAIDYLKEVCEICAKTRIGQLYTTAWKSIVIKNIRNEDRKYWSNLLDKYRINIRHAANELNWQIEDICNEALDLKIDLVKYFEEADLRTYGLCFAIKTKPNTGLFGSVIIRKKIEKSDEGEVLYEVAHTKNFKPNNKEYIIFKKGINKAELSKSLMALCDLYYALQIDVLPSPHQSEENKVLETFTEMYQCKHCLTVYDDGLKTLETEITMLDNFEKLEFYSCTVCDAPKQDFMIKKFQKVIL